MMGRPPARHRRRLVAGMNVLEYGDRGPVVVCNAGLGLSSALWRAAAPAIAQRGARVVAFDRPGLGASPASDRPRDVPAAIDEMNALLDELAADEPAVLVGHSWGGLFAKAFAWAEPHRVRALVLVDASHERESQTPAQRADDERLAAVIHRGRRVPDPLYVPVRATARAMQAVASARGRDAAAAAAELANHTLRTAAIVTAQRELEAAPVVEQQVLALAVERPALGIPVIALVGGRTYRDADRAQWWLDLQEDHVSVSSAGSVVVVERSGHFIPLEAPRAVADAVADAIAASE